MGIRIFLLWSGLVAAALADVPEPSACEQLHLVVEPDVQWPAGKSPEQEVEQLQRIGELQLHVHEYGEDSAQEFASGVLDLWLGAGLERLQQTMAHPVLPPLWQHEQLIWLRSGEVVSLEHWPQLNGLRGGFWLQQRVTGSLTGLQPHLELEAMHELDSPAMALVALLKGTIDFLVADRELINSLLMQAQAASDIEHLTRPVQASPRYLAISNNSACKDATLLQRLAAALQADS
ncbi:MAG: hypothetical protein ACOX0Y_00645 [Thiopseudomonas sp.]|jgi:hypothetical protein